MYLEEIGINTRICVDSAQDRDYCEYGIESPGSIGHGVRVSILLKLNLWLTTPKGAAPVNQTSATDWQMAVQRDNVISITLRQV